MTYLFPLDDVEGDVFYGLAVEVNRTSLDKFIPLGFVKKAIRVRLGFINRYSPFFFPNR